jgi:hypothetical protein
VAPRAESECEGLDRDFLLRRARPRLLSILLLSCSACEVLDYCRCSTATLIAKPNRQTNPSTTERVSTESSRRPDLRRSRGQQEFKIGIEWERFEEADNTLWTYHPELSGVCERGWNERIGKHSLATTNLSHPPIPFTCIGLSLGGEVVQYALPARRTRPRAWLGCTTLHHLSCTSKLAISTICKPQSKLAWQRQVIVVSIVIAFACTLAPQASRGWASDRSLRSCFRGLASKSVLLALPLREQYRG